MVKRAPIPSDFCSLYFYIWNFASQNHILNSTKLLMSKEGLDSSMLMYLQTQNYNYIFKTESETYCKRLQVDWIFFLDLKLW